MTRTRLSVTHAVYLIINFLFTYLYVNNCSEVQTGFTAEALENDNPDTQSSVCQHLPGNLLRGPEFSLQ